MGLHLQCYQKAKGGQGFSVPRPEGCHYDRPIHGRVRSSSYPDMSQVSSMPLWHSVQINGRQ